MAKGDGGVYEDTDGSWRAIVYIEGKPVRRRAPTRQAAEALRQELLKQRSSGVTPTSQTLDQWLDVWMASKSRRLSPRSQQNNQRFIDGYLTPLLGTVRLANLTAEEIQRTLNRVQDDIVRERPHLTGARTVRALAQVLNAALSLAVRRRILIFNPMDGVELPAYHRQVPEPWEDTELKGFLSRAEAHELAALWWLYGVLGLRRGEGLGLRWTDIDFSGAKISIANQIQHIGKELRAGKPKNQGRRILPLPLKISGMLTDLKARQEEQAQRRVSRWTSTGYVFVTRDGKPWWPSNLTAEFHVVVGRPVPLHSLRHTVATLLDELGASDAIKADLLGHQKKNITTQYTRGRVEAMRIYVNKVIERLS